MCSSRRKSTLNDEKNNELQGEKTLNELLSTCAEKSVELDLIEEVTRSMEQRLKERKQDLLQEKEKLENIHQQIWNSIESFCCSIWQFSAAHDFPGAINNYLDRAVTLSSKAAVEDPEKIQFLQYQISLLTEEIKTLRDNIETLDLEKNSIQCTLHNEENLKLPLREFHNTNEKLKIDSQPKTTNVSMQFSLKQVTLQESAKNIPEVPKILELRTCQNLKEHTLNAILKTPENRKIELKPKGSTFSLKRKTKICENYERNLSTK